MTTLPEFITDAMGLRAYLNAIVSENAGLRAKLTASLVDADKQRVGLQLVLTDKERAERRLADAEATVGKRDTRIREIAVERDEAVAGIEKTNDVLRGVRDPSGYPLYDHAAGLPLHERVAAVVGEMRRVVASRAKLSGDLEEANIATRDAGIPAGTLLPERIRLLASERDAAVSRADIATNWMGRYIAEEEAADDALDGLPETLRPAPGPLDQRVRSLASKVRNAAPFVMAAELQRVKQALAKVNEERRNAPHVSVAMAQAAIADAAADARRNALDEVAQSLAKMQEAQAQARESLREPNSGKSYS